MQFHNLKPIHKNKRGKIIGRGGKRGKTSGRGGKGQTARAGNKRRPELRDIIKKIPMLRGEGKGRAKSWNPSKIRPVILSLAVLSKLPAGAVVSPKTLVEARVVGLRYGKVPSVKILGGGEVDKKLTISGCLVSGSARAKIEKAGGTILNP